MGNGSDLLLDGLPVSAHSFGLMARFATSDWVLLVAVVVGGFGLSWLAMRLVLLETAKFSRGSPRETEATTDSVHSKPQAPLLEPGSNETDAGTSETRR